MEHKKQHTHLTWDRQRERKNIIEKNIHHGDLKKKKIWLWRADNTVRICKKEPFSPLKNAEKGSFLSKALILLFWFIFFGRKHGGKTCLIWNLSHTENGFFLKDWHVFYDLFKSFLFKNQIFGREKMFCLKFKKRLPLKIFLFCFQNRILIFGVKISQFYK